MLTSLKFIETYDVTLLRRAYGELRSGRRNLIRRTFPALTCSVFIIGLEVDFIANFLRA
jgi:hypothetical protein